MMSVANEVNDTEIQLRNNLISILGHESKGILANVFWMIEAIENGMDSPETLKEIIAELKTVSEKKLDSLNETISWIKLQQGFLTIRETSINIHSLFENIYSNFKNELLTQNIQLQFKGDKNVELITDQLLVTYIIQHLIQEAIDLSETEKNIIFQPIKSDKDFQIKILVENSNTDLLNTNIEKYKSEPSEEESNLQQRYIKDFAAQLNIEIQSKILDSKLLELRLIAPYKL